MGNTFDRIGVMIDMSRNAVMTLTALKEYAKELAEMGYNCLMLYTEDTYEIAGEPYFGHFRGRYSKAELKELNAFCVSLGMELIPCIQTLAHLDAIFRWPKYTKMRDTANILLAGAEESYALIEKMLDTVTECFSSKTIHIGMDEAHMLGLGKYLDINGFENRFEIFSRHLDAVCKMAEERGLSPVMWSDMFFRLKNNGQYYQAEDLIVPDEEECRIPKNVALTYWDYYTTDEARYEKMLHYHQEIGREIWYAGGIWTWKGFAPDNRFSIRANLAAIRACKKEKVKSIFFTLWGDNGGECSRFSVLPSLFATARFAAGEEDLEKIKADFEAKYAIPFDAFTLLDMHEHKEKENEIAKDAVTNPEKYLLYNDPFLGVCDSTLAGGENEFYASLSEKLKRFAKNERFGTLFYAHALLAKTLSHKAELGKRLRKAYQENHKKEAEDLLLEFDAAIEALEKFIPAFRALWMRENKPFGFEIQEGRLGGLLLRLRSCRERLFSWIKEGIEIPELAEAALDLRGGGEEFAKKAIRYPNWDKAHSVGII